MTKIEYIDFIRNSLPMVDKTNKFHPEQVAAAINVAVNTVFYEMYEQQPKSFKKAMERYSTIVQVAVDSTTAPHRKYTSTLTVDVVDLPSKSGGIFGIQLRNPGGFSITTTTEFVPVGILEGEQFYGAESTLPSNVVGFSWDRQRSIEYWIGAPISATWADDDLYVRVIKQFRSYASTDNVLLPYGQDTRIIELVREYLGVIPPKDLVNNNADIRTNG